VQLKMADPHDGEVPEDGLFELRILVVGNFLLERGRACLCPSRPAFWM
jgi:hypothetical protein